MDKGGAKAERGYPAGVIYNKWLTPLDTPPISWAANHNSGIQKL